MFFRKKGYVNNCTDENGGWALGCRIDGGQAEYVRVPFADQGLNKIPEGVTDRQALLVGDVLATGYGLHVFLRSQRRYCADHWSWSYRDLHFAKCYAEESKVYYYV